MTVDPRTEETRAVFDIGCDGASFTSKGALAFPTVSFEANTYVVWLQVSSGNDTLRKLASTTFEVRVIDAAVT